MSQSFPYGAIINKRGLNFSLVNVRKLYLVEHIGSLIVVNILPTRKISLKRRVLHTNKPLDDGRNTVDTRVLFDESEACWLFHNMEDAESYMIANKRGPSPRILFTVE